jgi:hypothetical protein
MAPDAPEVTTVTGGTHAVVGVVVGTVGGVVVPGVLGVVVRGVAGTEVEGDPVEAGVPEVDEIVVVELERAASAAFSLAMVAARRCCSAVKVVEVLEVTTLVDGEVAVAAGATWAPTQLSATAVTPTQPSSDADAALFGVVIGRPSSRGHHRRPSGHRRNTLRRRHRSTLVRWSKWWVQLRSSSLTLPLTRRLGHRSTPPLAAWTSEETS